MHPANQDQYQPIQQLIQIINSLREYLMPESKIKWKIRKLHILQVGCIYKDYPHYILDYPLTFGQCIIG